MLGIRPEDCHIADRRRARPAAHRRRATGDATYLTVSAGPKRVEVKAPRDFRAALDSRIAISFDPRRLHFFDADTGVRLRPAEPPFCRGLAGRAGAG